MRERQASAAARALGMWARDRSSRPRRFLRQTRPEIERRVWVARQRTGWGPRVLAGETVWRIRRSARSSGATVARARREPTGTVVRHEWPCPGLHMDVKRYPRFARPGHAVAGDRTKTHHEKVHPLGHDYLHAIVDYHSPIAYGELLGDERAATVTACCCQHVHHCATATGASASPLRPASSPIL